MVLLGEATVITSGKGGCGKSTMTAALGRAFSEAGHSVVLIDMDMGMRSLDLMLGVQDRVVYDLADVADGTVTLKPALVRVEADRELYLLSASPVQGGGAINPQEVLRIATSLKDRFDQVLIDCPAGVGRGFENSVSGADRAIVVVLPDRVSMRAADRVAGLLEAAGIEDLMMVVNRMPMDAPLMGGLTLDGIREALKIRYLGWIPDDPAIPMGGQPREIVDIARRLLGEDVPIAPHRQRSYLARLGRALRGR